MKTDKYLKIILTIIAVCLVWICVRDISIGGKNLFANNLNSPQDVTVSITDIDTSAEGAIFRAVQHGVTGAIMGNEPIQVSVR